MGFGFPKAERDGLIESDPETFFLPPTRDLRYQWVCAHLDRLDARGDARAGHRRLADVHADDAARPPGAAGADRGSLGGDGRGGVGRAAAAAPPPPAVRRRRTSLRGRTTVLRHLQESPTPQAADQRRDPRRRRSTAGSADRTGAGPFHRIAAMTQQPFSRPGAIDLSALKRPAGAARRRARPAERPAPARPGRRTGSTSTSRASRPRSRRR